MGVYLPSSMTKAPKQIESGVAPVAVVHSAGLPNQAPNRYTSLPTPSRWRFFPFLSRDSTNVTNEGHHTPSELAKPPRKGDVVCLSYNTLDDRAMRRLEGRSDHRPVIGSYAVYI